MKKLQKRKKGFTLTELAIVIAVIAILIAVLVPTFVSLIGSANESADQQAVKSMNTALSADEAINGKPDNAIEAMAVLEENGFDVENYVALDSGNTIYYDATYNRCLIWTTDENGKGSVSYPSDLASTYSSVTGVAANWYTFASIYNQTEADIVEATTADDITGAISDATAGDTVIVKLKEPITVTSLSNNKEDVNVTIDLNEQTLTMDSSVASTVSNGSTLYITNGTINTGSKFVINTGAYVAEDGSSITLEDVEISGTGSALYPAGDAAQINVIDCTINSTGYCIATNASTVYGCTINVENSYLYSSSCTALMVNVDVTVTVNNSTLENGTGDYVPVVLIRSGNVSISNSDIILNLAKADYNSIVFWGQGNYAPVTPIVIGDATTTSNYHSTDAVCNLSNVSVEIKSQDGNTAPTGYDEFIMIYMYGKDEAGYRAVLNYDSACNIKGSIKIGYKEEISTGTEKNAEYDCTTVTINNVAYAANNDTYKIIKSIEL